jgi:hypothetical protein
VIAVLWLALAQAPATTAAPAPAAMPEPGVAPPALAAQEGPEATAAPVDPGPPAGSQDPPRGLPFGAASVAPPERAGPPFYDAKEEDRLRARFGLPILRRDAPRRPVMRCFVADPSCGVTIELNATSAWGYRLRQGSLVSPDAYTWHSGRVQYDAWILFPALVETVGNHRTTRLAIGPKGGLIASDSSDLWGNFGVATRLWLGRGAFAPSLELTTALSFKLRGQDNLGRIGMERSPVGLQADIGVGVGGFGAIIIGGQYDTALAREEVPEPLRVATGGMFYAGFRGNIVWGLPAAAAITTHALVQRRVEAP